MSGDRLSPLPLYVSPRTLGRVTGLLFMGNAAVSWVAAGYDVAELRLVGSIREGASVESAERLAHGLAGDLFTALQLAAGALLAAAFLPWLYRARVNVRALGMRRLRYGREWTVLAFLVPVLQLFRPYQVVAEVWRASDPSSGDPMAWHRAAVSPLVGLWWGAFLAFVLIELGATLLLQVATGLPRVQLAHGLALVADVCAALSASIGTFVVSHVGRAQERKRARFGDGEVAAVQPLDPRDVPA